MQIERFLYFHTFGGEKKNTHKKKRCLDIKVQVDRTWRVFRSWGRPAAFPAPAPRDNAISSGNNPTPNFIAVKTRVRGHRLRVVGFWIF